MKRKLLTVAIAVGTAVLTAGLPAWALTGRLEAKIPFSFVVENTTLPSGTYQISTPDLNAPEVLEIRSQDGKNAVLVITEPTVRPTGQQEKTELVFNKMGNREILTQVWSAESNTGNQIPDATLHMKMSHQTMDMKNCHALPAHHTHAKKQTS